jgi:hypothetical protein
MEIMAKDRKSRSRSNNAGDNTPIDMQAQRKLMQKMKQSNNTKVRMFKMLKDLFVDRTCASKGNLLEMYTAH